MDLLERRKKEFIVSREQQVKDVFILMQNLTPIEQIMLMNLAELLEEIGRRNYMIRIQEKIDKYTVDFLLIYCPAANPSINKKIIIECDGHDYHERSKEQAAHDKKRDRFFQKSGYVVLRYTGSQIVKNKFEVLEDISEIIFGEDQEEGR